MSAVSHTTTTTHGNGNGHAHDGGGHGADIGFLRKYVFAIDHKVIALQFLFMGLMFMAVGGLLAMLIRWQLAWPEEWQKDNPIPILSTTLFSTFKTDVQIEVTEVDAAKKIV